MASYVGPPPLMLQLVLDHNCQHLGCSNAACPHCQYSSTRRCSSQLRPKYVSGELLLAGCGAAPAVLLAPAAGALAAGQQLLPGWKLQVRLLDTANYEAQTARQAWPLSMQQLAACLESGKALLKWGDGEPASCLTMDVQAGRACLSDLRCVKPERPKDGQKQNGKTTRFRLLFTVTTPGPLQGSAAVAPLVTDPFTVVTTRSRGAVKSEVPLPGEPVSRLQGISKDAAASLKALRAVAGQQVEPVETVSQFYSLQQWVTQGGTERLQQLLTTTGIKPADFKLASEHVQHTAFDDYRPRIWWQKQQGRGLLCSWKQDETVPDAVLAWALQQQQQQQQQQAYVLAPFAMPDMEQVLQLALQDWSSVGHGSWEVCWSDAADPLAQCWSVQRLPFNPQALPIGILNAIAAAGAAGVGAAPAGAAPPAVPAAAAGYGVHVVRPVQQQQQQELPAVPPAPAAAAGSFKMPAVLPPALQQQEVPAVATTLQAVQQPPPTPAMPLQSYVALLQEQQQPPLQQQAWHQELDLEQILQEPPQLQLPLGPQHLLPISSGPATPSCMSEPLMPPSDTDADLLVQRGLLAQTSDASTLMDQHLHLQQQPQKGQKLMQQQQQQAVAAQAAAVGHADVCVLSARPDMVTGPAEETAAELADVGAVASADRQTSLDLLLEDLLRESAAGAKSEMLVGDLLWADAATMTQLLGSL